MALQGKGFFTWQIRNTENGDVNAIAANAQQAGLTHLLIKIADGVSSYNVDLQTGVDLLPPLVTALRQRGLQVWGWHYVYGYDPIGEADKAIQRVQQFGLDGYVIDAEAEYKQPGKDEAATRFMDRLRSGLPRLTVALSSYRYPSFHPMFPWQEFLEKCDLNMPQVYWLQSHNPGEQLIRSVREFQAMSPSRPIIPTGAAFKEGTWTPTINDINEFMRTAQSLNLAAANFWEWSNCRKNLPEIWSTISSYNWAGGAPVPDITQQFISALNTRNPAQVINLYNQAAVHVTGERTVQGTAAITAWYTVLFRDLLPNATFTLTGFSGTGASRHLTWTATSSRGTVRYGSDTLGLLNGKITYHYTSFKIT